MRRSRKICETCGRTVANTLKQTKSTDYCIENSALCVEYRAGFIAGHHAGAAGEALTLKKR